MNSLEDPYLFALATPLLLCSMAAMCLWVWHNHRNHRDLLWQIGNLLCVAAAVCLQTAYRKSDPYLLVWPITALYLASCIGLVQSLALRLGQPLRWRRVAVVSIATVAGMWYYTEVHPSNLARITLLSIGMAAVMCWPLLRLARRPKRHALDHAAFALVLAIGIVTLTRPLLLLVGNDGAVVPASASAHTLVWWYALLTWLLLYVPYSAVLCGSALLDTMHTLRIERDHDALTSLLNRRAFEERCTTAPHTQGVRIVVVCDLDHFKRINDSYGHLAGDDVLRRFAQVLRNNLRESDVVARLGGEEFAIALWGVDRAQGMQMVQRIANVMPYTIWNTRTAAPFSITASFGLVQVTPSETLESALHRADMQLYAAKEAGRNCLRAA